MKKSIYACCLMTWLLLTNVGLFASTLPSGFTEKRIAKGLDPTGVTIMLDGRVLVTIKAGKILVFKNDVLLSTPMLNITVDNWNERGLLSCVVDPNFATNGYIYVYYTHKNTSTGISNNRVSRFTISGDVAVSGSEKVLLNFDNLSSVGWHNGGGLVYGSDGKLYMSTGENTVSSKAQSFKSLLGKVLRINPDGSIPTDNPYYTTTTGNYRAIYALGFRNPFKMKIQPGTGKILVNDVGASSWEEINVLAKGKNYGWPTIEGKRTNQTAPANYQDPAYAYSHSSGCSITGGSFYNPTSASFPGKYVGKYFFADYCNGWIKYADPANSYAVATFATGINRALDVAVDASGRMYYLSRGGLGGGTDADNTSSSQGELWRISYSGSNNVSITVQPQNQQVGVGTAITFVVSASGAAPLAYQWRRNGVAISGATTSSYTLTSPKLTDNGAKFSVVVSNATSSQTSTEATLTVISNTVPVAQILTPASGTKYNAGTTISFSGTATDAEDGTLPASAFTWRVDFQHDTHNHPSMDPVSGIKSGTFLIPDQGETSDTVWYRIYLTVTDAMGGQTTTYREIFPNKVQVILTTDPVGLPLKLDGTAVTAPYTFTGVVGIKRTIEVPNSAVQGDGTFYSFASWTNGGTALQTITTPSVNTTYRAIFTASVGPPSGKYEIVARHSGKVLDVKARSTADGANVQQWTYGGTTNQQWNLVSLGAGEYKITAVHSGKSLDVAGGSTADQANVQQFTYSGVASQRFRLEPIGSGYYYMVAAHSDKCVVVTASSTANGANVQQYTCKPTALNHQWSFTLLDAATARTSTDVASPEAESVGDDVVIYPNPSQTGSFTLTLLEPEPVSVKVYDGQGHVVHEQATKGGHQVNVDSKLKTGLYIIKVRGSKLNAAKKFIVN